MKPKLHLCPVCVNDGGWHYDDDGNGTRPHHEQATRQADAIRATELAHEQATAQARDIIEHAARSYVEFSANNVRREMELAQIDGPVISAAFNYAQRQRWIEATGQTVQSTDPRTRHRIFVWRSLLRLGVGA